MIPIITLAINLRTLQEEPKELICGLGADIYSNNMRDASLVGRTMLCFFRAVNFLIGCYRSVLERKWVPIIEKRVQFALFLTYVGFKKRMEEVEGNVQYIKDLYIRLKTTKADPAELTKFRQAKNAILQWEVYINHLVLPFKQVKNIETIVGAIVPYFKCAKQEYSFPDFFKKIPTLRYQTEPCEDFFIYMEAMEDQFPPVHLFQDVEGNKSEIKRWLRTTVEKSVFGYAIAIVVRCTTPEGLLRAFHTLLKDDPPLLKILKQSDARQQEFCEKLASGKQLVCFPTSGQSQAPYSVTHGPNYYNDREDCLFTIKHEQEPSWSVFIPKSPLISIILSSNATRDLKINDDERSTDFRTSAIPLFPFQTDNDFGRSLVMKNEGRPLIDAISETAPQQALTLKIEQWKKEDRQLYDLQPENLFYHKNDIYTNRVYRYVSFDPIPIGRLLFKLCSTHGYIYPQIACDSRVLQEDPQIKFYQAIARNAFQEAPQSIEIFIEQLSMPIFKDAVVKEGRKLQDKMFNYCVRYSSKADARQAFESKIPLAAFLGYHPDLQ